ncbi:MAG: recN [Acidimicrobiales bacterium]|nr:recN [Acidimicrobiales bacterium]
MSERSAARGQLLELAVTDLGVIDQIRLVFGPGMTALTGETGAGKTLLVGAIELLVGGRADPTLVRPGAAEAVIEGRFELDGEEIVLTRVIASEGRSRAYVNGRMATVAALAEHGTALVDLHGQHAHQSLLSAAVQREALDRFGDVDLGPLRRAHAEVRRLDDQLAALGGDAGARAREIDLLRFQLTELDAAAVGDPDEDARLDAEEDRLADAVAHRAAALSTAESLTGDGGALDAVAATIAALDGRQPFADAVIRLRSVSAELGDVAGEVRATGEGIEEDPGRLESLRGRRQLLSELRRKYGTAAIDSATAGTRAGTLADVLAYQADAAARLELLEQHDERAAAIDRDRAAAVDAEHRAAAKVAAQRRAAAPELAAAVVRHLHELAMPKARLEVVVEGRDPGDDVRFLLAANPGTPPLPLAKVASGGELARAMLALRLVLTAAPPTLVFDEVDAGIGGEAALVVGRALAALGADHQVLVVTHLPQVAAFADAQVNVAKEQRGATTVARAVTLGADERVVELSRMLSGTPESERVREAASELLTVASRERGR